MKQTKSDSHTGQWSNSIRSQVSEYQNRIYKAIDGQTYNSADGLFSMTLNGNLEVKTCKLRGDLLAVDGNAPMESTIVETFNQAMDDAFMKFLEAHQ